MRLDVRFDDFFIQFFLRHIRRQYGNQIGALDRISGYVLECEVSCVWQGFELTAVGTYDCGELIEIRDIEIGEKI